MGTFKKSLEFKPHKTITTTFLSSGDYDRLPYEHTKGSLGLSIPQKDQIFIRRTGNPELDKKTVQHEMQEIFAGKSPHEIDGVRYGWLSDIGDWFEETITEPFKENIIEPWKETVRDPIMEVLDPLLPEKFKEFQSKPFRTLEKVFVPEDEMTQRLIQVALGAVPGIGPALAAGFGALVASKGVPEGTKWYKAAPGVGMGGLQGYGLGSIGAGLGNWMIPGGTSFMTDFGAGMGNYFNTPLIPGMEGSAPGSWTLPGFGEGGMFASDGSGLVNASYKDPITGQIVQQWYNPTTGVFTAGEGGSAGLGETIQNILGNLLGGGEGGGGFDLNNILNTILGGSTTGTSGLGSTGLQALLSMLLGGQGTSFPSAPNYQSATDAMNEALALIKQEFPLSYGARENALAQLNQIFANPSAFYSQYQPTSLEQATASNLYATNLEQAKRTAGQRASMAGIETIFPELFAKAISPTITGIGEYLGGLGQTRATQGLQTLLAQIGIDPTALQGLTNLSASQSNLQTQAGYQNQLMEYFKKMEESQAKTSSLSTILGDILGGGGGLISPTTGGGGNILQNILGSIFGGGGTTTGTSGGSDILQTILNSVLGGGQGGGGLLGGIGNIFGNILGNIGKAIPVF